MLGPSLKATPVTVSLPSAQLARCQARCVALNAKGFGKVDTPQPQPSKKQSHMGNVPSPKQQQQFEEALANATEAKDVSPSTSDDDDDVVDPVVTNRMLSRVFIFAGLPVLFGLLLYPGFWYLKVVQKVDLPMGLVFVTQSITFGAGLLGISYGAMSASWDPSREGSGMGWTEFRANLAAIMNKK